MAHLIGESAQLDLTTTVYFVSEIARDGPVANHFGRSETNDVHVTEYGFYDSLLYRIHVVE